jgi:hypothetical protein
MVTRIMCDSMVHDAVARNALNLKRLIGNCRAAGLIAFNTTRIQLAQLFRIPAHKNIGQANAIDAERIGMPIFFCGWSRVGEDRLGGPGIKSAFEHLRMGNPKHSADALIGITALTDADILVTDDRAFRNRFKRVSTRVQTMSSAEFASYLGGLLAAN